MDQSSEQTMTLLLSSTANDKPETEIQEFLREKYALSTESYQGSITNVQKTSSKDDQDKNLQTCSSADTSLLDSDAKETRTLEAASPRSTLGRSRTDGEDEDQTGAKCIRRSSSPSLAMPKNRGAWNDTVGEGRIRKMHKFSLYETASRFYLVGGDIVDEKFRILKIDRTTESSDLNITEDDIVYSKKEINQLLNAVDDGNRSSGGLKLRCVYWGLLGFIRFTSQYYMLVITKRSQVAIIGGHYIYQVDGTELVSLTASSSSLFKIDRDPEEARFLGILNNLDLSRSFYFSYSYDITRTLQHNILHERQALRRGPADASLQHRNAMFVWNHHLLGPTFQSLKNTYDWCLPIVHGFIDQASKHSKQSFVVFVRLRCIALSIYGRTVYITIIARRSRYFAGARFLKRGANDLVVSCDR